MKKIINFMSIVLLLLLMVGCAGASDYSIVLINDYEVVRTSGEHVFIAKRESELSWGEQVIPPYYDGIFEEEHPEYVIEVGYDKDRYILAKTNKNLYYILDAQTEKLYDSLNEKQFKEQKEKLKISKEVELKDLDEYKKAK